jgi:large subunit ribosomal protein L24
MKIKVNDKVLVISGKDKGKVSKVIRVIVKHNQVVVEKVNMRTKHIKKTQSRAGEKITFEAPMDASNVMVMDPKENKPTRVGYRMLENGKKERISKLSGVSLDAAAEATTKAKASKKKAL